MAAQLTAVQHARRNASVGDIHHDQLEQAVVDEYPVTGAHVVRKALDGLNDRQRMAVILNKFEDMNYAEIADVMGLTTKAVKSLLSRARTRLRECLQPYIYMDGNPPPTDPPDDPDDT